MASFFGKIFSLFGSASGPEQPAPQASVAYNGFTIRATPYSEGGQYQTSGVITHEADGATKEHRFIRADRFAALEDAVSFTLAKGRQIVDEHNRAPHASRLFDG